MYYWNTDKIAKDLSELQLVSSVVNGGKGGDIDTDTLVIEVEGTEDRLFVCGFNVEDYEVPRTDVDVELIQLTDGEDSRGGLNSRNFSVAQVYIEVRQYFVDRGGSVVNSIKDYF